MFSGATHLYPENARNPSANEDSARTDASSGETHTKIRIYSSPIPKIPPVKNRSHPLECIAINKTWILYRKRHKNRNDFEGCYDPAMRTFSLIAVLAAVLIAASPVWADLSPRSAFVLVRRVAPGDEFKDATAFLGLHAAEWTADEASGLKLRRWGTAADEWTFDVLHDTRVVRATRIAWNVRGRRDRQRLFSQLTTEGRKFFGFAATFRGHEEAEWTELDGTLLVRARIEEGADGGVTLLTGIRKDRMESEKYGF